MRVLRVRYVYFTGHLMSCIIAITTASRAAWPTGCPAPARSPPPHGRASAGDSLYRLLEKRWDAPGVCGLVAERRTRDQHGRVSEYVRSLDHADRYDLRLRLERE